MPFARVVAFLLAIAAAAASGAGSEARQTDRFDILIRNARVFDGNGNPWIRADVGIVRDRIAAVGRLGGATGAKTLDAEGLALAPGFIDVHSHAGGGLATDELKHGRPVLAQGITTVIVNPDGGGPTDLDAQAGRYARQGIGLNVGLMVPHGSVREAVMGMTDRDPDSEQIAEMVDLVRRGMRAGALGLSSGLYYAPGSYARTGEVVALARMAAQFGGVYSSHIRDESDYSIGVVAAVQEVITIAEQAGLIGVVSHMKALGPASHGLSLALVERIEAARARGVQVYADQYPYSASGTGIVGALVPRWAQVGGRDALLDAAARAGAREDRRRGAREHRPPRRRRHADDQPLRARPVARRPPPRRARGRGRPAAGGARAGSPGPRRRQPGVVQHVRARHRADHAAAMDDDQHRRRPGADRTAASRTRAPTAPSRASCGCTCARSRSSTCPSRMRSMTSLPAQVFGLKDRGQIRPGAFADILVFDPAAIRDAATYEDPHQLAEGMTHILVNGVLVRENGTFTSDLPGRVLAPERR